MTTAPLPVRRSPAVTEAPAATSGRRPVLLVVVALTALASCVLALVVAGGRPVTAPPGLPDAGLATGWALRTVRLLGHLTAAVTVGSLLVAAVLVPSTGGRGLGPTARAAVGAARRWAGAWAGLTAMLVLLTAADTGGVPLTDLRPSLLVSTTATDAGVGLALAVVAVALVAAGAARVTTVAGARTVLVLALAALLPAPLTGHASSGADADVAAAGLAVHVVAAALWTGGLAALVLQLRRTPATLAVAVPRFSRLALAAYVALAGSGLLAATGHLGLARSTWTSGYGGLVAAKAAVLVVLGVVGHLHRRRTIPRLAAGAWAPFLRLGAVELVIMGSALGLAAALARTPAPAVAVSTGQTHGSGHSSLPGAVERISLTELLTAWRPNAVVLVLLAVALGLYLCATRALAAHGDPWPRLRTAAFVGGLALALLDLCSGVATYATALVSVQLAQLLVALVLVPLLLTLGSPVTLWVRVRASCGAAPPAFLLSRQARALLTPAVGAAAVCALLLGLYRSPLIDLSLRSSWVHLAVLLLAVGAGLLLWWAVLGTDPVPNPRDAGERTWCVLAVAGCLAMLALQLRFGDQLLAAPWFLELRWGWVDPVSDQRLGGAIAGAAALATGLLAVLMVSGRRSPRG